MLWPKTSDEAISRRMRAVKNRNTFPEVAFKKELRIHKIKYLSHPSRITGCPDLIIKNRRIAVFIDGDFWHGHQWKMRGYSSLAAQFKNVSNKKYWVEKIQRNCKRDRYVNRTLRMQGWTVLRFWESELKKNPEKCMRQIKRRAKQPNNQ
ncbi:MAG: very short patch repair endonuclease [Candidatus Omnitrophota bacterium]